MRQFIDIITKINETEILSEAQNYEAMMNPVINRLKQVVASFSSEQLSGMGSRYYDNEDQTKEFILQSETTFLTNEFKEDLVWAKQNLKKSDRIVWFLKYSRIGIIYKYRELLGAEYLENTIKESGLNISATELKYYSNFMNNVKRKLEHYLSLPIQAIQNYQFNKQSAVEAFTYFDDAEAEWREARENLIPFDPEDKAVIQFTDGFAWVHLSRASCSAEGDAMGHCGNAGSPSSGDTILSLRKLVTVGNDRFWQPSLTFILDKENYLGEMKGRGNEKPVEKYHPYILRLLESDIVKGIKGGGYLPQNNFSITDLSQEQQDALMEKKPELATPLFYYEKHGLDKTLEDKIAAIMKTHVLQFYGFTPNKEFVNVDKWNDWQDMLIDLGSSDTNRLIKNMDDMFAFADYDVDNDTIEDFFLSNFSDKAAEIGEYLKNNNAEDIASWEEANDEEFDPSSKHDVIGVIIFSENEFYDALRRGVEDGQRSGAEQDMIDSIKKTFSKELDGISLNTVQNLKVYADFDNDGNNFAWDTKVFLSVPIKDFLTIIGNEEDLDIIHNEGWLDERIDIDEPQYGWSGFDEAHAKESALDQMPDWSLRS